MSGGEQLATILSQAMAPVFMITGAAALINIMSQRFGRVIDRIRFLLRNGSSLYRHEKTFDHVTVEIKALYRRAKILRRAIITSVLGVFSVSLTVFSIFFDIAFNMHLITPLMPQISFISSLVCLMISMAMFMQDFIISLQTIKADIKARSDVQLYQDSEEAP